MVIQLFWYFLCAPSFSLYHLYLYLSLSHVSAGGTRHVMRRRRRADGTYSDAESYHSDQDEEGKKRRQQRRKERKAAAIKEKQAKFAKGKRNPDGGSESDYSYRSVISAGIHITKTTTMIIVYDLSSLLTRKGIQ